VTGQLRHESSTIDPRDVRRKVAYIRPQNYLLSYKPVDLI